MYLATQHWTISFFALLIVPLSSGLSLQQKQLSRRDAAACFFGGIAAGVCSPAAFLEQSTTAAHALDLSNYVDGPQGLKYRVTKGGDGTIKPERAQKVRTSYTLYLNGFPDDDDTSSKRSQQIDSSKGLFGDKPFEFLVGTNQVIKGWDLALLDMKQGEARRLVVPSELGYGEKGAGGKIPGGSTLYFEVELTEIGKKPYLGPDQLKWLEEHPL